ncbi:hypothetical protein HC864_03960 [Candidatus Gracilibacteria bacterium]|nr:hypothetical protein [Candidatus Gracilibacteria bacterium]
MKVISWNMWVKNLDPIGNLKKLIAAESPDIICLQEVKINVLEFVHDGLLRVMIIYMVLIFASIREVFMKIITWLLCPKRKYSTKKLIRFMLITRLNGLYGILGGGGMNQSSFCMLI